MIAGPELRGKSIYMRNAGPENFYLSPEDEGKEFAPQATAQVCQRVAAAAAPRTGRSENN
jgi:hypothetical protein